MGILEKVAWAIDSAKKTRPTNSNGRATAAITAFLEAAAANGWHMCQDEATEEMQLAAQDRAAPPIGQIGLQQVTVPCSPLRPNSSGKVVAEYRCSSCNHEWKQELGPNKGWDANGHFIQPLHHLMGVQLAGTFT